MKCVQFSLMVAHFCFYAFIQGKYCCFICDDTGKPPLRLCIADTLTISQHIRMSWTYLFSRPVSEPFFRFFIFLALQKKEEKTENPFFFIINVHIFFSRTQKMLRKRGTPGLPTFTKYIHQTPPSTQVTLSHRAQYNIIYIIYNINCRIYTV